jgi:hypothetical protein
VFSNQQLQKEPESAEKTLSKLQKQCLVYSENLMKDLLSLDAISTSTLPGSEQASEEVRPLRKQQVKEIQVLLPFSTRPRGCHLTLLTNITPHRACYRMWTR